MNLWAPPAHAAPLSGTIAVTSPASGKLAAGTPKQVVLLTVSGTGAPTLSEETVTSVDLGSTCIGLTSYVVTSSTTLTVKTPTTTPSIGCPANGAESVTINFGSDSLTKASAITFVNPPDIEAVANKPVIAENSSGLATAQQNQRFWSTGGQTVRVKAAAGFTFDPRTAAGLKVALGGKDATDVKVYAGSTAGGLNADTQMTATNTTDAVATAQVGNYVTFKSTTGMDPTNDTITLTQNGVSKTFAKAATGVEVATGEVITSISPESGKSSGGTTLVITGTGFSKTNADYGTTINVTVCGVNATFPATAINTAGTQITAITPNVTGVSGLGTGVYGGACPVRIVNGTWTSPITPSTIFAALNE
ncbi:IPT/TIG domain-containing protein [Actinoplanes sichuanensis]|uniref:IPT/TIG domain-containing protein n=1 Tax=Actinoplanes sichuanensis TaxID=512349 RepID=A0ABW4AI65_9ACTN|nr:IPT/TIG domain-containing protein [Actinoplanes sichuanensis]